MVFYTEMPFQYFLLVTLYHLLLWPLLRKKSYDTSQETMLQNESPMLHTTLQKMLLTKDTQIKTNSINIFTAT